MTLFTQSKKITYVLALSMLAASCTSSPSLLAHKADTPAVHSNSLTPTTTISIGGHIFRAVVVKTPSEQAKGLSGIKHIDRDEGMLFIFSNPSRQSFWMKGMLVPLDILWIQNHKVIGIEKNIPAPKPNGALEDLPLYTPTENIDAALEVPGGTADQLHLKSGDQVQ